MNIAGFTKFSLIDYPGRISAVVFLQGCNLRCPYCHNRELVIPGFFSKTVEEGEFFRFLKQRKGKLQGVVITGGEPTIQRDLEFFVKKIKDLGFYVKIDTNGLNPDVIENLIQKRLVDYIAMDIKAPLEKYEKLSGVTVDKEKLKSSISIIRAGKVDYEFRTTLIKGILSYLDIERIVSLIKGSKRYVLQNFYPDGNLVDTGFRNFSSFSKNELFDIKSSIEKYFKEVVVRD
jgi:pyruvate formate lyase activating enzyme